jgi:hypothetical protein
MTLTQLPILLTNFIGRERELASVEGILTSTLNSGFSEPRMPWPVVRAVTSDDDLKAMYNYLHNLPPVQGSTQ